MDTWSDLRIIAVAELPGFHNPFKCARREIFDQALLDTVIAGRRQWQIWKPSATKLLESLTVDETEEITRAARRRLGPEEIERCRRLCPCHFPEWRRLAALACTLVQTHGPTLDADMIELAACEIHPPDRWAFSITADRADRVARRIKDAN